MNTLITNKLASKFIRNRKKIGDQPQTQVVMMQEVFVFRRCSVDLPMVNSSRRREFIRISLRPDQFADSFRPF